MIAFIIIALILITIGGNEGLGYYLEHCGDQDLIDCFLNNAEEPEAEGAVTATGVYNFKDYSVTITANIPLEGGAVTGSVAGSCQGKVKATFNGENNGAISGTMTGTCDPFFVNIPASAQFSGTVNKDSQTVPFAFTGQGAGFTHQGSMSLTY